MLWHPLLIIFMSCLMNLIKIVYFHSYNNKIVINRLLMFCPSYLQVPACDSLIISDLCIWATLFISITALVYYIFLYIKLSWTEIYSLSIVLHVTDDCLFATNMVCLSAVLLLLYSASVLSDGGEYIFFYNYLSLLEILYITLLSSTGKARI